MANAEATSAIGRAEKREAVLGDIVGRFWWGTEDRTGLKSQASTDELDEAKFDREERDVFCRCHVV